MQAVAQLGGGDLRRGAVMLERMISNQAAQIGFNEIFQLLGILFLAVILFVDDEQNVLNGIARLVRNLVDAELCTSPKAAARLLEDPDPGSGREFAVIADGEAPVDRADAVLVDRPAFG